MYHILLLCTCVTSTHYSYLPTYKSANQWTGIAESARPFQEDDRIRNEEAYMYMYCMHVLCTSTAERQHTWYILKHTSTDQWLICLHVAIFITHGCWYKYHTIRPMSSIAFFLSSFSFDPVFWFPSFLTLFLLRSQGTVQHVNHLPSSFLSTLFSPVYKSIDLFFLLITI